MQDPGSYWPQTSVSGTFFWESRTNRSSQKLIEAEQEHPSPRKEVRGYTVYASRAFDSPSGTSIGVSLLSDFGSAVSGDVEHDEDVQPNVYRAPEVCLKAPWSYSIDIWNVGCLGKRTAEFLDEDGQWRGGIPVPDRTSLEESEENLEGSNKEAFDSCGRWCSGDPKIDRLQTSCWRTTG